MEHEGDLLVIPVERVDYIQASGSYMIVHVGTNRYVLRERMKALERENKELRRANEILKSASIFFAGELDPRPKR